MSKLDSPRFARLQAKLRGEKRYTNGKPCPKGHIGDRMTSNGRCVQCMYEQYTPEEKRRQGMVRRLTKPERVKMIQAAHREKNREKINEKNRAYLKANRKRYNAHWMNYWAAKLQAMPSWADKQKIEEIYQSRQPGQEVDHIIPLRGENVCGLHVHYNLQILPLSENRRKGNRLAA